MNKNIVLEVKNVAKGYDLGDKRLEILKNVNLALQGGEWLTLLGASGSGKTTLLNLLGLLESPDSGSIAVAGVDYATLKGRGAARFRNVKLGFVFQSYCLLPELTLLENVMLPAMFHGRNAEKVARELLDRVGLSKRLKHHPMELSGGEQQRASIARALINNPDILLADEPTGNLDSKSGNEILELFTELRSAAPNRAIVMITHNEELVHLADQVLTLKDGTLV